MGIYCYTLRKATVQAGDMQIGHAKYAFKDGLGATRTPRAKRAFASAARARSANPNLRYIVIGDFKYAMQEPLPVFEVGEEWDSYFDGKNPGRIVGTLTKKWGKPYVFTPTNTPAG